MLVQDHLGAGYDAGSFPFQVDEMGSNNETDSKKACLLSSMEAAASVSEGSNGILLDKDPPNERRDCPVNGNGEHGIGDHEEATDPVPQIHPASSPEANDMVATSSKMSTDSQDAAEPPVEQESNRKRKANNINLASKAATNGEPDKRIKWDCGAHFSDRLDADPPNDSQSPVASPQDQASASNPDRVPRERCMYGARCYRKNPNHKNNYSHPDDSDYDDDDDREECPYGAKCYRKNPQHKEQFKHTSVPRRRRRAATPVHSANDNASETEESVEESVDESDYEPSVYTESSDDWDDRSELDDGTTG
ncbi:PREDICTED: aprataxin and PNK-like factor isoform X2 [Vollenhovia emeryi]|uniref:aprataxin and PNK-like factor isoform X2 n=1 Tax=Vollenhovia emeryi TaxID=411798 RepID=UPI0005F51DB8|nr:PREDICTED: aprataxin and PNK-like factor isoform X2 [Vollenhovia emeryi]